MNEKIAARIRDLENLKKFQWSVIGEALYKINQLESRINELNMLAESAPDAPQNLQ